MTIPFALRCTVHIAFYLWYGTPEIDGRWIHWNHPTLPHWDDRVDKRFPRFNFDPPDLPHAPYRPQRGLYSSGDLAVIQAQMREISDMEIDTIMFSWWGQANTTQGGVTRRDDSASGANTDLLVPPVLAAASRAGIGVSFHIEPYGGRSPESFVQDAAYILKSYGQALFAANGKSDSHDGSRSANVIFWLYDVSTQHTEMGERRRWRHALAQVRQHWRQHPIGRAANEKRGESDRHAGEPVTLIPVFLCLWIEAPDDTQTARFMADTGFNGGYSYFAATGFTPAADPRKWAGTGRIIGEEGGPDGLRAEFVPSVGPGYDDRLIRPWNAQSVRARRGRRATGSGRGRGSSSSGIDTGDGDSSNNADYYDRMWRGALGSGANMVTITSYNEWGEGTQIEPAKPHTSGNGVASEDYGEDGKNLYMHLTGEWVERAKHHCSGASKPAEEVVEQPDAPHEDKLSERRARSGESFDRMKEL